MEKDKPLYLQCFMKEGLCDYEVSDRNNTNAVREYYLPRKKELREILNFNPNVIIADFLKHYGSKKRSYQKLFYWADEGGIFNYKLIKREVPIDEFNNIISCFYTIRGKKIPPLVLRRAIELCKTNNLDMQIMIPRIYTLTLPKYFFLELLLGKGCQIAYKLKQWHFCEQGSKIEFNDKYYKYFSDKNLLSKLVNKTLLEEVV